MTRIKKKFEAIMETLCELENEKELEETCLKNLRDAISLEVGADDRTIRKYQVLLKKHGFIEPIGRSGVFRILRMKFADTQKKLAVVNG